MIAIVHNMSKKPTKSLFTNELKNIFIAAVFLFFSCHVQAQNPSFKFDINKYKDKVVYLDFWASWCIPCRKSFPWMNEMHHKFKDDGLVIIAVNLDEEAEEAARFLAKYPSDFVIEYDDGQLAEKYNVKGMPFSLLFDANGKVVKEHIGFKFTETNEYEETFKKVLGVDK